MTWKLRLLFLAGLGFLGVAAGSTADELVLAPASSQVTFLLPATLHQVHGSFQLVEGRICFDLASHAVAGRIVLDAQSAQTGLASRDRNLKETVLDSERFPQIVFEPERLEVVAQSGDEAQVRLHGEVEIRGLRKPLEIPAHVTRHAQAIRIQSDFEVPYVAWGLPDPSVLILKVAPEVSLHLDVQAVIRSQGPGLASVAEPTGCPDP